LHPDIMQNKKHFSFFPLKKCSSFIEKIWKKLINRTNSLNFNSS